MAYSVADREYMSRALGAGRPGSLYHGAQSQCWLCAG